MYSTNESKSTPLPPLDSWANTASKAASVSNTTPSAFRHAFSSFLSRTPSLFLSKWLNVSRNSLSCSGVTPTRFCCPKISDSMAIFFFLAMPRSVSNSVCSSSSEWSVIGLSSIWAASNTALAFSRPCSCAEPPSMPVSTCDTCCSCSFKSPLPLCRAVRWSCSHAWNALARSAKSRWKPSLCAWMAWRMCFSRSRSARPSEAQRSSISAVVQPAAGR
mmetsp:Transcript_29091/g.73124  ORF Transcript_29091/g.73124 Transcript_29091/m.73124 type:complete len:218 (-) Transcript_29091:1119-1772(-)